MGKIDEMRRRREAQVAQQERGAGASRASAHRTVVDGATATAPSRRVAVEEVGRCAGCGKDRALRGGLIVDHQKGLGKMCPGARKPPL